MSGVNKVFLLGRLGKDPDIKTFEGGGKIAQFSIATSETYKDKTTGEKKEITDWHNIKAAGPVVDIIEKYLKKGSQVHIEGKNRTRSWEKDGQTRYLTEVIVTGLTLVGGGGGNSAPASPDDQPASEPAYAGEGAPVASDDVPF